MVIVQYRAKRKPSGGRYISARKKRKHEIGREPALTKIAAKRIKIIRSRAGARKLRILKIDIVNLFDPKTKSYSQAVIKSVTENPANKQFVRRNIITKGAVIDTDKGKAKVTSRPGQEGAINAVLIQ